MREKRPRPLSRLSLNLEAYRRAGGRPVARGGFSDVFKVHSREHGCVAVKRLRFNQSEKADLEHMAAGEARVLTMIMHPHILPFLGVCYMGGDLCIVTPWAENGPLSLYLAVEPEADRLKHLCQVASALSYLHTYAGDIIIHGDLHLDNVLISDEGTALLSDFGLSRIVPEGNSSSQWRGDAADPRIGKVIYEAPELHGGAPRSWATDVFAFAMLAFHAYSEKRPCEGMQNFISSLLLLYGGQRPKRSEIQRSDFLDDLWNLVQQCWSHDPQQRPRMPIVYRAMQDLLDSRDVPSVPHGSEPPQSGTDRLFHRIFHNDRHVDNCAIADEETTLLSDIGFNHLVPDDNCSSMCLPTSRSIGRVVYEEPESPQQRPRMPIVYRAMQDLLDSRDVPAVPHGSEPPQSGTDRLFHRMFYNDRQVDNCAISDEETTLLSDIGFNHLVPDDNCSSMCLPTNRSIGRVVYEEPESPQQRPRMRVVPAHTPAQSAGGGTSGLTLVDSGPRGTKRIPPWSQDVGDAPTKVLRRLEPRCPYCGGHSQRVRMPRRRATMM